MSSTPFQECFIENFGMEPTLRQWELIHLLENFAKNKGTNDLFLLKGYAGTGKTSVMGAYVKTLTDLRIKTKLLAPTGRAAKVFSQKSNKQDAFTIHKQIYRRKSKADFSSPLSLQPNLSKNTLFIVDEASMIGDYTMNNDGSISGRNLLDDLIDYVYSAEGCKLVFLGDDGQLPPVGSDYSPAMSMDYLKHHYPNLNIFNFTLEEVLRQSKNSDILLNATTLRKPEKEGYPKFVLTGQEDLLRLPGEYLQEILENSFNNYGIEDTIIITRSNKRANAYNNQVRARILWYEDLICSGDYMMVVKNNYFWTNDDSKMGFIANGEILVVKRILKFEEMYGFQFARLQVQFIDYEEEGEIEILVLTETLNSDGPSLSRERMKELFFEVEKDYYHIRDKKKRYEAILENPYFNALQVKYAYAVTCHKSQGGQWKNVFIDLGYVTEDMMNGEFYRWLYTAITRGSEKVYLVNFPDDFFETK